MSTSMVEKFHSMDYGPAPEDASEVTRWLDAHQRTFGHYIDGTFTTPTATFTTTNPATGEPPRPVASYEPINAAGSSQANTLTTVELQPLTKHVNLPVPEPKKSDPPIFNCPEFNILAIND